MSAYIIITYPDRRPVVCVYPSNADAVKAYIEDAEDEATYYRSSPLEELEHWPTVRTERDADEAYERIGSVREVHLIREGDAIDYP